MLSVFINSVEGCQGNTKVFSELFGLNCPDSHQFVSAEEAQAYIEEVSITDKTYEGVVLRDKNGLRIKCKTSSYVALHAICSNGNIGAYKHLIHFVYNGDTDELEVYFPEVKDRVAEMQRSIEKAWNEIDSLWFCYHDEKNQKKFALAVKDSPYKGVLFQARSKGIDPIELWTEETILKLVFDSRPTKGRRKYLEQKGTNHV